MTTVAHGPYEHVGAYAELAESEVFDTSGTPNNFCPVCEHAPCIGGGVKFCEQDPRFIVVQALEEEIRYLAFDTIHATRPEAEAGLRLAIWSGAAGLKWAAWYRNTAGNSALNQLVLMRKYLRRAKEAQQS